VAWVLVAALINAAQPGDNLEQLVLSHDLSWGYSKHPPFSTWLLIGVQFIFGRSPWLTYWLAAACSILTLICMNKIACELLDPGAAAWVILLLLLTYTFTRKAQFYNHNTVLLLGLSLMTWTALRAIKTNNEWLWMLLGLSIGALILSKYQSVIGILIIGIILTKWCSKKHLWGIALAIGVLLLTTFPHIYWLINSDGLNPISYGEGFISLKIQVQNLKYIGSFFLGLIKQYFLCALFITLAWQWRVKAPFDKASRASPLSPFASNVIYHLTWTRLIVMTCIGSLGVRLQDHWSMPLAMFMSLPLANLIWKHIGSPNSRCFQLFFAAQVAALSLFIIQHQGYLIDRNFNHIERHLSVESLVDQVSQQWQSKAHCPPTELAGPIELTTLFAAYAPNRMEISDPDNSQPGSTSIVARRGKIQFMYADQSTLGDLKSDYSIEVQAYKDLLGLPDRKVQVHFFYPTNSCD